MARQERPVDPSTGPVQALAYELRKLRADAGNPTYRALARTAGYSATTLSEAAGGIRLPTLEVLLAYVGACGGDPEDWRRRWQEAADLLRPAGNAAGTPDLVAEVPDRAAGVPDSGSWAAAPVADQAAVEQGESRPDRPAARRRWPGPLVTATLTALVVAVAVGVGFSRHDGTPATPPATGTPGCPSPPGDAAFTGTTYGGGAHVRVGATRDAPVLTTIPAGCTVGFTGFCVGEKVYDNTGGTPDVRWFAVVGGGLVSSAVIHGNPPRELSATGCPNGRPTPSTLDFSVSAATDRSAPVVLHASGTDLYVVGFATAPGGPASPGTPNWRQVGLVDVRDPAAGASARLDGPARSRLAPTLLVAAACLGGDSPTGLVRALRLPATGTGRAVPVTLDPGQQRDAAASACRYPNAG